MCFVNPFKQNGVRCEFKAKHGLHFSGSESDDLPAPPPPAEVGEGTLEVETTAVTPGGLVGSSSDATANQGEDETNANLEFKSMLDTQNNVPVSQSSSLFQY